jgi:hypothetical protein
MFTFLGAMPRLENDTHGLPRHGGSVNQLVQGRCQRQEGSRETIPHERLARKKKDASEFKKKETR